MVIAVNNFAFALNCITAIIIVLPAYIYIINQSWSDLLEMYFINWLFTFNKPIICTNSNKSHFTIFALPLNTIIKMVM